ncbi:integral membrane protein [Periconia macrospinosa]|uniref:Integral membrane protein n=1 Tax=Periconia macrospinosa TaxID=97972 RepID=A0A2V1DZJ5_9PLEO|nr:integral membrane protein [Periconia macrospinosa]
MTPLWAVNLLLLKFSILTLYLRIFPNKWLRRCVAIFTAFSICYTVPLIFLAAFQCNPVHATWDLDAQKNPGTKCIDWIAVLRATVVFEVIAEIVLFVLPIPIVLKLQMQKSKKIILMGFFGLGITYVLPLNACPVV